MTRARLGGYASKSNKGPRVEQGQSQQGEERRTNRSTWTRHTAKVTQEEFSIENLLGSSLRKD